MIRTLGPVVLAFVFAVGCSKDESSSSKTKHPAHPATKAAAHNKPQAKPEPKPKPRMVPDRTADVARARALWSRAGAEYKHWNAATAKPVKGRKPHGRFIQAFYNDVAK